MLEIIAHRGYSALFRENSVAAWQGAVAARADIIEIDVRRSADGEFVCAHDPDLRIASHPGIIEHMTGAEIAQVLSAPGVPAAPPLQQAFDVIPASTAVLFDVKDETGPALGELHGLRRQFPQHRLVFGLHSLSSVRAMRSLGNADILGLLSGDPAKDAPFFDCGGNVLRLWESMITPERVAHLRDQGRPLWMTTGGRGTARAVGEFSPEAIRRHRDLGISGFLVNDPVRARATLSR